ncbi:MAG: hypothetical protein JXA67_20895 [Micromonosporaceae bacterium]|nr:hypothetical protein [Micromonosporaceae bacterium]
MRFVTAACRRWANPLRAMTATSFVASLAIHHGSWVHALIGMVFALTATGHVLANSRWIRTVTKRIGRELPSRITVDAAVDAVLVTLVAVVAATGIAAILHPTGTASAGAAGELHGHAAILLVVAVVVHVARHRRRHTRGGAGRRRPGRDPATFQVPSVRERS